MRSSILLIPVLLAACGSPSEPTFASVCDGPAPPPECTASCDPAHGSQDCPIGFHCDRGRCDAQCRVATDDCGPGYTCTGDGYCLPVDPAGPDASCPAVKFQAMQTTPAIHLLVDRSTSMLDPIDAAGTITKYDAVRDALVDPSAGIVTSLQDQAYFGASLYTYLDTPCPELRSVGRAKQNRAAIANLIDTTSPMGATPTGPAIDAVVASFAAAPPPATSPRFIVLATDGLPNKCPGDPVDARARAVSAVADAFAANIRVFVLAVDAGIPTTHLQDLANAGVGHAGAPYYVATSPQQLTAAFDQIIGGVVSCELAISGQVDAAAAASGTVKLDGQLVPYGTGWILAGPSLLRLLGAACQTLQTTPNATVEATFPCGAVLQ